MSRALVLVLWVFGMVLAVMPQTGEAERRGEASAVPAPVTPVRDFDRREDLRGTGTATQPIGRASQEPLPGLQIVESALEGENPIEGIAWSAWDFRKQRTFLRRFQHLLASGVLAPDTSAGVLLPTSALGADVIGADDGLGGRYVAWVEGGSGNGDLYALRLSSDGRAAQGWPEAGLALAVGPYSATHPEVVADATGAWFVWQDHRDRVNSSIFAQRIQANGELALGLPGQGIRVVESDNDQGSPSAVADGEGGLLIAWLASIEDESVIRLLRVNAGGSAALGWDAEGLVVSPKGARPTDPRVTPVSQSSYLLTWEDGGIANASVRALRLESDGSIAKGWPLTGAVFSGGPGRNSSPQVVADGFGGAFVAWTNDQDSTGQVLLSRVTANGQAANGWPPTGLVVSAHSGNDNAASLMPDGTGGVVIVWEDRQLDDSNLRGQRYTTAGTVAQGWSAEGVVLASSPDHEVLPQLTSDGSGGALVTWTRLHGSGAGGASGRLSSVASLQGAEAWPDLVRITWNLSESFNGSWSVQHPMIGGQWEPAVGRTGRDGSALVFEDDRPQVGTLVRYRLLLTTTERTMVLPEVAVSVPVFVPLALHSARTDGAHLKVKLALESRKPAKLDGYDVQGRRVLHYDLRDLPPGEQELSLTLPSPFAAGMYFLRLEQGRSSRNARLVHIR